MSQALFIFALALSFGAGWILCLTTQAYRFVERTGKLHNRPDDDPMCGGGE